MHMQQISLGSIYVIIYNLQYKKKLLGRIRNSKLIVGIDFIIVQTIITKEPSAQF
jgi:hypothetical protein